MDFSDESVNEFEMRFHIIVSDVPLDSGNETKDI